MKILDEKVFWGGSIVSLFLFASLASASVQYAGVDIPKKGKSSSISKKWTDKVVHLPVALDDEDVFPRLPISFNVSLHSDEIKGEGASTFENDSSIFYAIAEHQGIFSIDLQQHSIFSANNKHYFHYRIHGVGTYAETSTQLVKTSTVKQFLEWDDGQQNITLRILGMYDTDEFWVVKLQFGYQIWIEKDSMEEGDPAKLKKHTENIYNSISIEKCFAKHSSKPLMSVSIQTEKKHDAEVNSSTQSNYWFDYVPKAIHCRMDELNLKEKTYSIKQVFEQGFNNPLISDEKFYFIVY
ncbi:MAG: hypothetical protein IT286_03820 [Proteobacteria bacterium]|nr:hypothetical protein [Pseudomonadota bacterium]